MAVMNGVQCVGVVATTKVERWKQGGEERLKTAEDHGEALQFAERKLRLGRLERTAANDHLL